MKKIYLSKAITASQLISLGIEVEFDKSNSQMKLAISDKLTLKFNEFREGEKSKKGVEKTSVIIELDYSIENFESPIKYFEIEDKDPAVFEFIKNEIFTSIGVYLKTEQELFDVERDMTIYAMGFHEILYTDTVFNQLKEYIWENELERHCENYLFAVSEIRAKNKLGLGLRAIHSRIDYLNGTLSMSDDINKGTRYVIRIPLTTSPNA